MAHLREQLTTALDKHGTKALLGLPDDEFDCCVDEIIEAFLVFLRSHYVTRTITKHIEMEEQVKAESYRAWHGAAAAADAISKAAIR